MLPSEMMSWQPEFTDKTLSRISGAVQFTRKFHPFSSTQVAEEPLFIRR
ncbi:transposase [Escherichia coli APEC O2]|nr:transposase [Escherichia coli]KZF27798.1 transposase [Escherichia coli APEC O2]MCH6742944.1 transposase [Escherichia coli]